MPIQASQIDDLVVTTQKHLGKMRWTEIAMDLQDYIALRRILNKKKVKFQGGTEIQWNVMVDYNNTAKLTGLFAKDTTNVGDAMTTASIPWRHATTSYAYDRREVAMNRPTKVQIVDLVETRRAQAMMGLADLMEDIFWGKPDDSDDTLTPYGVEYWIVKASSGEDGFVGGNPDGFTSGCAGLNATTYPNWKNYAADYAAIDDDDFLEKLRRAARKTKFKSPVKHKDYDLGSNYGYYTNDTVLTALEKLLRASNDNLGRDFHKFQGEVYFKKSPIEWVPKLEDETDDPFYGINWGLFQPVFLAGEYMNEMPPQKAPEQHTVSVVYIDLSFNFRCTNRRMGGFVLSKVT